MALFLLAFYLPYVLLHAYFFAKARAALRLGFAGAALLSAFLALMVAAPILVHGLERAGQVFAPRALSLVAYPWMAVVAWSGVMALAVDAWNAAARLVRRSAAAPVVPPRRAFAAIMALTAILCAWGVVEASRLTVREVSLETDGLPPGSGEIRLVQISDVHLGIDRGGRVLRKVLDKVRALQPDVLVSTGDLVDTSFCVIDSLAERLREIDPPLGKFAVLGNHEFYAGLENALAFHKAAGFRLLRGESADLGSGLRLAGVDDPAGGYTHQEYLADEEALFRGLAAGPATIFLKHQPSIEPGSAGRFDLQLSGHVHGGQMFPFHLVIRLMYPLGPGLHDVGQGSRLFVSRGAGTWGPPFRVLAPPDICLVVIRPRSAAR